MGILRYQSHRNRQTQDHTYVHIHGHAYIKHLKPRQAHVSVGAALCSLTGIREDTDVQEGFARVSTKLAVVTVSQAENIHLYPLKRALTPLPSGEV